MDKNTLIGFLLIGVVLFAFSWLNQPTPEQVEAQRRYQDSIAQIEHARQLDQSRNDKLPLATAADSLPGESDSARIQRIRSEYDVFADAVIERSNLLPWKMIRWKSALQTKGDGFILPV